MSRVDHQKVQLAYFRDGGVKAVKALFDNDKVSAHTVRRALTEMRKADDDDGGLDALEDWMRDAAIITERNRRPRPGDVKRYKAQEVDGAKFLRLPLDTFGADKGEEVEVQFFNGSARVSDIPTEGNSV